MSDKKNSFGSFPDWLVPDMDHDDDHDLKDMWLYDEMRERQKELFEKSSYLDEDEEDELDDDDALMEHLSELDKTEREFFLMDHPTIQRRIEDDPDLTDFMSELDAENEDDEFYDEDDEFEDEDVDDSDEEDVFDARDEEWDDEGCDAFGYDKGVLARRREAQRNLRYSNNDEQSERSRFILKGSSVAARYLTIWGDYLYASAIKTKFDLPFNVPDEVDHVQMRLYDLMENLIAVDVRQALICWDWCLDEFLPYLNYTNEPEELTYPLFLLCENYTDELLDYVKQHPAFLEKVILHTREELFGVHYIVVRALEKGETMMAKRVMEYALANRYIPLNKKIDCVDFSVFLCAQQDDISVMRAFQEYVFPLVHTVTDIRFANQVPIWNERMDEIEKEHEEGSEDDLYTGENAWREKYRENPITWLVDPVDYDDEEEYLQASQERKYAWRRGLTNVYDIRPEDFETRPEYEAALSEARRKEREEREEKWRKMMHVEDTTVYKFCKVSTNYPLKPHYYYLTGGLDVKVGDLVAVPLGYKNAETLGVVVSVGQCYSFSFPCALDAMKTVLRIEETSSHE